MRLIILWALASLLAAPVLAQTAPQPTPPRKVNVLGGHAKPIPPGPVAPAWYEDAKFGLFIH